MCASGITVDMLGRFSSAEVCCPNPAETEGRKQEGEVEKHDNGEREGESGGEQCWCF